MYFLHYVLLSVLLLTANLAGAETQLKLRPLQHIAKDSFATMVQSTNNPSVLYGITPVTSLSVQLSTFQYTSKKSGGFLYKSIDQGKSWQALNIDGGMSKIVVDPNSDNTLYALQQQEASPSSFLKSLNGGITWEKMPMRPDYYLSDIVIEPQQPSIIYVPSFGTGFLYKSEDRGNTWKTVSTLSVTSLIINPNRVNSLYSASDNQLYQSHDAGITWQPIKHNLTQDAINPKNLIFRKLWGNSAQSDRLYLDALVTKTKYTETGSIVTYESLDAGFTWQLIPLPVVTDCAFECYQGLIHLDPYRKGLYSYSVAANNEYILYRSTDDGNTWETLFKTTAGVPQSILTHPQQANLLYLSLTGKTYYASGGLPYEQIPEGQVWVSDTAGKTWARSENLPNKAISLSKPMLHPSNTQIFYASGEDTKVYQTTDAGQHFTALPDFINGITNKALGISNKILAVTEQAIFGGRYRWMDQQWQPYFTESIDNIYHMAAIDSSLYVEMQSIYYRSRDNGITWHTLNAGKPMPQYNLPWYYYDFDSNNRNMRLIIHPSQKAVFYAYGYIGYNPGTAPVVYQSQDEGETWQDISGNLPIVESDEIAIYQLLPHPQQTNILYFAYDGHLHKTVDNGRTWNIVGSDILPNDWFDIWFDLNNSQTLYAMAEMTGYVDIAAYHPILYKSTDGGDTWRNVTQQLQDDNANSVSFEALRFAADSGKIIYIAKAKATGRMYQSEDGEHWELITDAAKWMNESPTGVLLSFSLPRFIFQGTYTVTAKGNMVMTDNSSQIDINNNLLTSENVNINLQVIAPAQYAAQSLVNLKQTDTVAIQAKFEINNSESYEQPAAFYVLSNYQPNNSVDSYWFMQTLDHTWQAWDSNLEHLQPAKIVNQLQPVEYIDVFTGVPQGLAGISTIYTAYRPHSSTVTFSNKNAPLVLKVE